MKRKKTWLILSSVLLMILGVFIFSSKSTSAYLIDNDQVTNILQVGKVETHVDEDVTGLLKKSIGVTNSGNVPVFVRMMVCIPEKIAGVEVKISQKHLDMWEQVGDYWYYKEVLQGNASTVDLYDMIQYTIDPNVSINPQQLSVVIYAESIQADNLYDKDKNKVTTPEAAFKLLETQEN